MQFLPCNVYSQNNSTSNGLWDSHANWANGIPQKGEVLTISNDIILNTDIEINGSGYYTIQGSVIDPSGGSKYKIKIKDSGQLKISGNVTIEGELKVEDNGILTVEGCDTLRIGGKLEFKDNSKIVLESCAVIIVGGEMKFGDNVYAIVDGNIVVNKKVEAKDNVIVSGSGNIQSDKEIKAKDNSIMFGSNAGCDPGPCSIGNGNALPIVLVDFEASALFSNKISVRWETLSEINNDYFTLLYSIDGTNYKEIETIVGAGNSSVNLVYNTVIDDLAVNGKTYYLKLRQTDYNGNFEEFDPIAIQNRNYRIENTESIVLFPNPSNGGSIFVEIKNLQAGIFSLNIFSTSGEKIITKQISIPENNNYLKIELLEGRKLPKGTYFLQVASPEKSIEKKFIIY
jgi:uncharacterized protein (DUF2147 family)